MADIHKAGNPGVTMVPEPASIGHAVRAFAASGVLARLRPRQIPTFVAAWRDQGATVDALVRAAAVRHPDRPAVIDERGTLTYRELADLAARLATGLRVRHRVGPDRPVAVLCRNHRYWVAAAAAVTRAGADLICLNTEFSRHEVRRVVAAQRPVLVIGDDEFATTLDDVGCPVLWAWHDEPSGPTLDDLAAAHEPAPRDRRVVPGRIVVLTSGTTGQPKIAARRPSRRELFNQFVTLIRRMRLRTGEPVLIAPPLFHGFGWAMWLRAALLTSPVVLLRRFDPAATLAAIERHHVALLVAVPIMLQRMLDLPAADLARCDTTSLRAVLTGGATMPVAAAERFMATFGPVLYSAYGSSESGILSVAGPQDLREAPGSVGRPVVGTSVDILDAHGVPVPCGDQGQVVVGGRPTGDVGHVDHQGRLFIDGRVDDMIVSGGENVYPGEVEEVLSAHPAILDAAVVGVPDPDYGQRLVAYLVARPGQPRPTPGELKRYVQGGLARYKTPRDFTFVDAIPRTATGKTMRRHAGATQRGRQPRVENDT